ncbi:MAG: tRNA epoxyqueuosine(34) reductase QueG [Gammaproteobacteria bacterium]|nr:tRNA epoxyqueuosine(34) reductase QueG [Gammaproteobacteria bacterium]
MSSKLDNFAGLTRRIRKWAKDLGFQQTGICGVDLRDDEKALEQWLALEYHGEMSYMARHGRRRSRPAELRPGTVSVVSVRMDYLPSDAADPETVLNNPDSAYISRYALGRDYHKVMRRRLQRLADRIGDEVGEFGYRVFVDSGPVLEKPLARNAGLGWIGKHTNLINRSAGSYFFLGELLTDLPLVADQPATEHCGSCRSCIDVCPTDAIVGPFELDARRCISYLTIEMRGSIPEALRPHIGNRIFGCDDCQLVCPWNKFARTTGETDFAPRHGLDAATLIELFAWTEEQFLARTAGSPIRRIGYECWLRNIAVALGNAPGRAETVAALRTRASHASPLVREHVGWALFRHGLR